MSKISMNLQPLLFLIWILPLMSVQKDVVHLSNTGPAIAGTEIVFKAEVSDGTSHPVQDEKYFEYHWLNTANGLKETTMGYKNTTQKSCNWQHIRPKKYKMIVSVWDVHDQEQNKFIGRAESHFRITAELNGNLNVSQELKYREPDAAQVYSTKKPIRLHLNLTDKFSVKPSMAYSWFLDGEFSMATNKPEIVLPVHERGEHTVKVEAKSVDGVEFCDGFNSEQLKGHFNETVILKDPVDVNVTGAAEVKKSDPIVIDITLDGSDPFTVCWNSSHTSGMECIHALSDTLCIDDWCCQNLTNVTEYNITIWNPSAGDYSFNISISNDVSIVYKEYNVTVKEPTPEPTNHNAADVILPVIGALIAICFILAGVIYVMKVRKKKHVEVADFDFHPTITRTERRRSSFAINIKYAFRWMFERNNYERTHRHPSYAAPQSCKYGSLDETSAKESLFETL